MDVFEEKYGKQEHADARQFHMSRRMFCIHDDTLYIAKPRVPYSHAVWFEKEGWISRDDTSEMDTIVRGIVDRAGNVFFYTGFDFRVDARCESIFFKHLSELVSKLRLAADAELLGGLQHSRPSDAWKPRKKYGCIKDRLHSL